MTTVPYRRRNRHRWLSIVGAGLLVLLTVMLTLTGRTEARTALLQSGDLELDTSSVTIPDELETAILKALQEKPDDFFEGSQYVLTSARVEGDWALVSIASLDAPSSEAEAVGVGDSSSLIIAQRLPDNTWIAALQDDKDFVALIEKAPDNLLSTEAKQILSTSQPKGATLQAVDMKFPWDQSQSWTLTAGWHIGNSLDIAPVRIEPNKWVLAAHDGIVTRSCSIGEVSANLEVTHSDGTRTSYVHLDKNSIPENILGTQVRQGQQLGLLCEKVHNQGPCKTINKRCEFRDGCGESTAPHLHFVVPSRNIMIDGWNISDVAQRVDSWFNSSNERKLTSEPPAPVCEELDSNNPPSETDGWQQWDTEETFNLNNCKPLLTGDTNGDGRTDLICPYNYTNEANTTQTWVKEATSDGFGPWTRWGALHASDTPPSDPYAGAFNIDNCASILPAHLDNDQRTDLLCVYDYGNNTTRTWAQLSSASNPANRKWQFWGALHKANAAPNDPYAGAFNVKNCKPLLADDLDNDQRTDLLCVYDYGNNTTRTWAQLSSASSVENRKWQFWGALHEANAPTNDPYAGEFNVNNCTTIVTGHLDGDAKPDLACVYDYGNDTTRTWAQLSSDNNPNNRKWRFWGALHEKTTASEDPYAGAFNVKKCASLAAGDIDNDQKTDLICVYDYGNEMTRTWVQRYADGGNGNRKWHFWGPLHSADTPEGSFNAQNCTLLEANDIDGDGDTDLVCSYDYGTICNAPKDTSRTWVQRSTGSAFEAWTPTGSPDGSGFRLENCTPLTLGDVNNDEQTDLLCPYDYGNEKTRTWVQSLDIPPYPGPTDPPPTASDKPVLGFAVPLSIEQGDTPKIPFTISDVETTDDVRGVTARIESSNPSVLQPLNQPKPSLGDFFPPASNFMVDLLDNGFYVTLTAPFDQDARSGSGTIANLSYLAKKEGCTTLRLAEHTLGNSKKRAVDHTAEEVEVCVTKSSSSSDKGTLRGELYLESGTSPAGVQITLMQGSKVVSTAKTGANGVFSFPNLSKGTYTIRASRALYVEAVRRNIRVAGGDTVDLGEIGLYAGDVNMPQDGRVDQIDWRFVKTAIFPVSNPYFDIDASGKTDLLDLLYVEGNYRRSPATMRTTNAPGSAPLGIGISLAETTDTEPSRATTLQDDVQYVTAATDDETSVVVSIEDFKGTYYGVGARLTLPEGVEVTDFVARGTFANESVYVHQDGKNAYISAVVTGDEPVSGDTEIVRLTLSKSAKVQVVAETIVMESNPPSLVYIPLIIR